MGFDSDRFRTSIAQVGAQAVIPSSRSRSQAIPYDKHLYEERNLVERYIQQNQLSPHRHALRENCALVCVHAILSWYHDMAPLPQDLGPLSFFVWRSGDPRVEQTKVSRLERY